MMTTDLVFHTIKDALAYKTPFSLVRFGDGEAMVLSEDEHARNFVMNRQLGYVPEKDIQQEIKDNLFDAFLESDIIGRPTDRHILKQGFWAEADSIIDKIAPTNNFCSIDVHYNFLTEGRYEKLLSNLDDLYYISCRDLDNRFKEIFNIKNIHSFIIPPEMAFESKYDGDRHYPEAYGNACDWIKEIDAKGKLLLVGGGIVGKSYCEKWKQQGGVAFDIGSVFDDFAGRITRGPERGIDVYTEKNKL